MRIRPEPALTFDDVLLVPKRSSVRSRRMVSTATQLSRRIRLAAPVVSSNMDTVTEARMAIAMARLGGIGIIHRFMAQGRQATEVEQVKRAEGYVVEQPQLIAPDATVAEARRTLAEQGIGGLVVIGGDGGILGIVTTRDLLFEERSDRPVADVMTPRDQLIIGDPDATLATARRSLHSGRIEKLPLIDAEGRLHGLVTAQDIKKLDAWPDATKDDRGRLRVGAAIGVRPSDIERAALCVEAGIDAYGEYTWISHFQNALADIRLALALVRLENNAFPNQTFDRLSNFCKCRFCRQVDHHPILFHTV